MAKNKMQKRQDSFGAKQAAYDILRNRPSNNSIWDFMYNKPTNAEVQRLCKKLR